MGVSVKGLIDEYDKDYAYTLHLTGLGWFDWTLTNLAVSQEDKNFLAYLSHIILIHQLTESTKLPATLIMVRDVYVRGHKLGVSDIRNHLRRLLDENDIVNHAEYKYAKHWRRKDRLEYTKENS